MQTSKTDSCDQQQQQQHAQWMENRTQVLDEVGYLHIWQIMINCFCVFHFNGGPGAG